MCQRGREARPQVTFLQLICIHKDISFYTKHSPYLLLLSSFSLGFYILYWHLYGSWCSATSTCLTPLDIPTKSVGNFLLSKPFRVVKSSMSSFEILPCNALTWHSCSWLTDSSVSANVLPVWNLKVLSNVQGLPTFAEEFDARELTQSKRGSSAPELPQSRGAWEHGQDSLKQ